MARGSGCGVSASQTVAPRAGVSPLIDAARAILEPRDLIAVVGAVGMLTPLLGFANWLRGARSRIDPADALGERSGLTIGDLCFALFLSNLVVRIIGPGHLRKILEVGA